MRATSWGGSGTRSTHFSSTSPIAEAGRQSSTVSGRFREGGRGTAEAGGREGRIASGVLQTEAGRREGRGGGRQAD